MKSEGVHPNQITFLALLSACAHSGLVEKGRQCFSEMQSKITLQVHHYACMVDMLAKAGLFEEAEEVIRSMPMKADVYVWGALLGGCQMQGNLELGEEVAKRLISLEPWNHVFYVGLCEVYRKAGKFDEVKRVRGLMKQNGIRKEVAGCSMIEVEGVVYEFSAGGSPDVMIDVVAEILNSLNNDINDQSLLYPIVVPLATLTPST
ncbi:Pentatricopeptide repeat-containing protein At2g22410, mitochondrial [Linum grandiflorum]